jgi:hypothetical protein
MAIEALIRKRLAGSWPAPGARPGIGALGLADYAQVFEGRAIRTGWREDRPEPLYPRLLGTAFAGLPAVVQRLHRPGPRATWTGRAEVTRGRGLLAGFACRVFGFPEAGAGVPVSVTFTTDATGRETWARWFGGRVMRSTQEAGRGRNSALLVERFGPFAFGLALVAEGGRLSLVNRRWSCLGLPLPRGLMPGGTAWEAADAEGRFRFHVEITQPLAGRVVRYDGWLTDTPARTGAAGAVRRPQARRRAGDGGSAARARPRLRRIRSACPRRRSPRSARPPPSRPRGRGWPRSGRVSASPAARRGR